MSDQLPKFKEYDFRPYEVYRPGRKNRRSCDQCKLKKRKCNLNEFQNSCNLVKKSGDASENSLESSIKCSCCKNLGIPCTLNILPKRRGPKPKLLQGKSFYDFHIDSISNGTFDGSGNASTSQGDQISETSTCSAPQLLSSLQTSIADDRSVVSDPFSCFSEGMQSRQHRSNTYLQNRPTRCKC